MAEKPTHNFTHDFDGTPFSPEKTKALKDHWNAATKAADERYTKQKEAVNKKPKS